ncbi:MAG: hypothetical protein GC161_02660 [Planctomycetaceae bacterium]|nr:hypothetical protein [Planctomycetaceae bacterium]
MKEPQWLAAVALLPVGLLLTACKANEAAPPAAPPPHVAARFQAELGALDALQFLVGTWRREDGELWHQEVWSEPRGGRMVGHAHLVRGARSVFTEALAIRSMGGVVVYVATPEDEPTTLFPAAELRSGYARFEAPEHDFPQVIEYRLTEDGALVVRLAGDDGPAEPETQHGHGDHDHAPTRREVEMRFERAPQRP